METFFLHHSRVIVVIYIGVTTKSCTKARYAIFDKKTTEKILYAIKFIICYKNGRFGE